MKLLRLMMLAAIFANCAAHAFAQQPVCTLKQAPEFNGFQLGMAVPEVKDKLADTSMFDSKISSLNKIGAQTIRISGAELKDEYAEGIDDMNLTFVDKKLAMVRATYHGGSGVWFSSKDFFKQLSEKLGIPQPSGANPASGKGSEKYRVDCAGFNVTLAYSFGVSPSVTIADATAQKLVNERSERNPDGEVREINITPGRSRRPTPMPTPTIPPR
jgi:opacity protein-like surface antigen